MYYRIPISIVIVLVLVSCAGMPDVKVGYYLPQSELEVVVTQTAACSKGDIPILKTDVTFNTIFSRDTDQLKYFDLDELDGFWSSKEDVTFQFYPDGRLKSINTAQTGKGSEILKSVVGLADQVFEFKNYSPAKYVFNSALGKDVVDQSNKFTVACNQLRELVDENKPLTPVSIVRRGRTKTYNNITLVQNQLPKKVFENLEEILGEVEVEITFLQQRGLHIYKPGVCETTESRTDNDSKNVIYLVEPAVAEIEVVVQGASVKNPATFSGNALVPQDSRSCRYALPVQKGPWFGNNKFSLSVAESGRVTKLMYAGDAGIVDVVGSLSAVYKPFQNGEKGTVADKAAKTKAEADLIYEQQRLVQCQLDATACKK